MQADCSSRAMRRRTSTSSPTGTRTRIERAKSCSRCSRSSSSRAWATSGRIRATAVKFVDEQIKQYEESLKAAEGPPEGLPAEIPGRGRAGRTRLFRAAREIARRRSRARGWSLRAAEQSRDSYKRELAGEAPVLLPEGADFGAADRRSLPHRRAPGNAARGARLAHAPLHRRASGRRRHQAHHRATRGAAPTGTAGACARRPPRRQSPAEAAADRNPVFQQLKVSLAEAEANVASLRAKLASHEAQYAQLKAAARLVPQVEAELTPAQSRLRHPEENLRDTARAARIRAIGEGVQDAGGTQFRVIDPPRVSPQPVPPTRIALLLIAFAAALAAGLVASFAASQVMPTFHDARSLREVHQASDPRHGDDVSKQSFEQVAASQRAPVCWWHGRTARVVRRRLRCCAGSSWPACYEGRSMSLIEQAAKRLEELRRAGAGLPTNAAHAEGARERPSMRCRRRKHRSADSAGGDSSVSTAGLAPPPGLDSATAKRCRAQRAALRRPCEARRRDSRSISSGLKAAASSLPTRRDRRLADEFRVDQAADHPQRAGRAGQSQQRQPGHGDQRAAGRRQDVHRGESRDERCHGVRHYRDAGRRRRRPPRSCPSSSACRNSPGLLELLTRDDLDVSDVLVRTNIENLSILPAGRASAARDRAPCERTDGNVLRELRRAIPTGSSSSTRRRCCRRPRRGCSPRTWDRSSWSSPPTARASTRSISPSRRSRSCDIVLMVLNKADKTDVGSYYGYYADDAARVGDPAAGASRQPRAVRILASARGPVANRSLAPMAPA